MLSAEDSGFGDQHTLQVVSAALRDTPISVISSVDQRIVKSHYVLQHYHQQLPQGLLSTLQDLSQKIAVEHAVIFLLDAYQEQLVTEAVEILNAVLDDTQSKRYTRDDLASVLLNMTKNEIPAVWLLATFGEVVDMDNTPELNPHNWSQGVERNQSGLNIQAMRDFK